MRIRIIGRKSQTTLSEKLIPSCDILIGQVLKFMEEQRRKLMRCRASERKEPLKRLNGGKPEEVKGFR